MAGEPGEEGGRLEGAHTWHSQPALHMCVSVCVLEGWREEVAKSGPRGGLQSSTPRAWVAFDVARRLWWLRLWRNAARPPSPPKKPPELWNASQAAARPAGMGLEHRRTILPCLLPPPRFSLPPCPLEWTTWRQPCPDDGGEKRRMYFQLWLSLVPHRSFNLRPPWRLCRFSIS